MKKTVRSLVICLLLIFTPCASYADTSGIGKLGSVLTTSLLGLSTGMIVGGMVAAFSGNPSAHPVLIGGAIGFGLGFGLALFSPSPAGDGQGRSRNESAASSVFPASDPGLNPSAPVGRREAALPHEVLP